MCIQLVSLHYTHICKYPSVAYMYVIIIIIDTICNECHVLIVKALAEGKSRLRDSLSFRRSEYSIRTRKIELWRCYMHHSSIPGLTA